VRIRREGRQQGADSSAQAQEAQVQEDDSSAQAQEDAVDTQCRYNNLSVNRCKNPRAPKRYVGLNTLCTFHSEKQKAYKRKFRERHATK